MEDEMIMNIVSRVEGKAGGNNCEEDGNGGKKMSKTEIKKLKYSNKLKQRNKFSRSKSTHKQKQTDFLEKNIFANNIQQTHDNIERGRQMNKNIKKEYQSVDHNYKNNGFKGRDFKDTQMKKSASEQQHKMLSYRKKSMKKSQTEHNMQFRPELRKQIQVAELLPENNNGSYQIDISQLSQFKLQPKLEESLIKSGVTKLTQIQANSYELLLTGVDSVIKASTGSGKTLAYLIPLVNRMVKQKIITKRDDGVCVMVVCPTRQLCTQGQKQACRCLKRFPYIVAGCLLGGEETNHEKSRLRKGINILFCTPGRVLYHMEQTKCFKLENVQVVVFEEADRTLDMGFEDTVHKILTILKEKIQLSHIQKVLVSAHFNQKVSNLLQQLEINQPNFIGFNNVDYKMELSKLKQNNNLQINTSKYLKQQYVLMSEEEKIPIMLAYLGVIPMCKVLVFVSTIDQVEYFQYLFNNLRFRDSNGNNTQTRFQSRPIFKIHGDLDQKLRTKTYLQFRASKQAILISTEVASRGLDFPDLSHIILFDVPPTITDYGNRVGRSARFNQTGVSLLMLYYTQSDFAQKIRYYAPSLQIIGKEIIYQGFEKVLKSMNIGDSALHYLQGLVRSEVKSDEQKYMVARKAYTSMLRAYAKLRDGKIFAVKKLNLKLLARTFGLNNVQGNHSYNSDQGKISRLEKERKKRKVLKVKDMQILEYL